MQGSMRIGGCATSATWDETERPHAQEDEELAVVPEGQASGETGARCPDCGGKCRRCRWGEDNLRDEPSQVGVGRALDVQIAGQMS